ncbi:MAG: threonine synthase, partial [Lachnospiraceae bacterium]|nr:threonine synthase [Lachnospiraceae bacterium]
AAKVYKNFVTESGDGKKTVIASTASPYKFTRSVMMAIDEKYATEEDFALVDELSRLAGTEVPQAIEDIRSAEVLHKTVCEIDQMQTEVKKFLGI